jgi:hypothetical protein
MFGSTEQAEWQSRIKLTGPNEHFRKINELTKLYTLTRPNVDS